MIDRNPYRTAGRTVTHLEVGGASGDNGAGVGNTGALNLEVGQALELVVGQGVGRLRVHEVGGRVGSDAWGRTRVPRSARQPIRFVAIKNDAEKRQISAPILRSNLGDSPQPEGWRQPEQRQQRARTRPSAPCRRPGPWRACGQEQDNSCVDSMCTTAMLKREIRSSCNIILLTCDKCRSAVISPR